MWKLTLENYINIIFSPIQRMPQILPKIFLFRRKMRGKKKKTEIKEKKNKGVIFQWYEEEPRTRR
jgi:hypothetical protein